MNSLPVSVIINTLNEEKNIANCLESVKWADEIVLVDMYSDDKTVEIAKRFTDKFYFHDRTGYVEPARKFALDNATNNWVLMIDADELVPVKLKNSLGEIIKSDDYDIVHIPRKNYIFGKLMTYTHWGAVQDSQLRFFKKDFIEFTGMIHESIQIKGNPRILKIPDAEKGFIHFNYSTVEDFLIRLNKYTSIEAANIYTGIKKDISLSHLLYITAREFFNRFIRFKGYKDGIHGFYLSCAMSFYHLTTFIKLQLMKKYKSTEPKENVLKIYSELTQKVLDEYGND